MSRAPAHAGRLRPAEQLVFASVFALMAGFVVMITMFAARSPENLLFGGRTAAAGSQTVPAGTGGTVHQPGRSADEDPAVRSASPRLNALLAAAMGNVLAARPGRLAVGVIDETTGQLALYGATQHFSSGSIVTADILAALLVRNERGSAAVTSEQAVLATAMMDNGSSAAATSLWRAVGGGSGLASANRLLSLSQTIPGAGDRWDQTRTTVADQLQLLTDLTSARSRLAGPARTYVLRLMVSHGTTPRWGVSAAGTGNEVDGSSLPAGPVWSANSIGVVVHAGHVLLIAILSSGSSSRAAGLSLASAAAAAAADVMTRAGH